MSADIQSYTSSILQSCVAYFISVLLWFCQKKWPRMYQILYFPKLFRGEPLPMEKGHYCVSVTTTTPPSSPNPYLPSATRWQWRCSVFNRPPQVSSCLLFVRGCLLYSLLKRFLTVWPLHFKFVGKWNIFSYCIVVASSITRYF